MRLRGPPLLHFLLMGGVLFAAESWVRERFPPREEIEIGADEVQRLRADWQRETARAPASAELQASLRQRVDEEILLREALRLELDRTDPVVRARLLANMRFAFADAGGDDEALLREARALSMSARDPVVRRRLVQLMESRYTGEARVTEAELRDYVARHPQRYARAARIGFRHAFFQDEGQARAALTAGTEPVGEMFLLGNRFDGATPEEVARLFGEEIARALTRSAHGAWQGPLRSAYGWHLVRVESFVPAATADFETVRTQAAYALLAERERRAVRDRLDALRSRYPVRIAGERLALGP